MNASTNFASALTLPCVLGEELVSQLISGFSGNHLNDDASETALIAKIDNKIISACETHLNSVVQHFFKREDADELAIAFDVDAEHLKSLKSGLGLKSTLLESTRKVIMLSTVTAVMGFEALENMVSDCLIDLSK